MNKELAVKLIDELSSGNFRIERLFFHLMGEPILHPDFLELATYAIRKGLPLSVYTNGSLLNSHILKQLFDAKLPELVISFQTPDPKSFEYRNDSLSYEQYGDNIKTLILEKERTQPSTLVELRFLNTQKDNFLSPRFWLVDKEIEILEEKCKLEYFLNTLNRSLKRKSIFIDTEEIMKKVLLRRGVFRIEMLKNIFLVCTTFFSWNTRKDAKLPNFKKACFGSCDGFQNQVAVLWDGSVTSCCVDYDGENTVGNVNNKSLKEVLSNKAAVNFIKSLHRGILPTEYCQICRGAKNIKVWLTKQLGSILIYNFVDRVFNR